MSPGIDLLAILSLFLLSVPLSIAGFVIYRWAKPQSPPHHRRFFWAGAVIPFLLTLMFLPALVPGIGLGVIWCFVVVWALVCWAASSVQRRVMKFEPQIRKLVTIFVFSGFLVFPLFYAFILPQMEYDSMVREAERQWRGRTELIGRAIKGNAKAQYNLAQIYAKGEEGIAQDFVEAAKWYRKAAEQGDAEAQAALGRLYANGTGVPQEDKEAYFWLSVALSGANEDNKGWISTLLERTELYMDKAEVRAAKKRAAEWKPSTGKGTPP
jgi:hypothetical protein